MILNFVKVQKKYQVEQFNIVLIDQYCIKQQQTYYHKCKFEKLKYITLSVKYNTKCSIYMNSYNLTNNMINQV